MKSFAATLLFGSSALLFTSNIALADVPYYDLKAGKTTLFFAENNAIYRAGCPSDKPVNVRSDCNIDHKFKIANTDVLNEFFIKRFSEIVITARELLPLHQDAVALLLQGPQADATAIQTQIKELTTKRTGLSSLFQRFGDADTKSKIADIDREIGTLNAKIAKNSTYANALSDFFELGKQFTDNIADSTKWLELVESKNKDQLVGVFAKILSNSSNFPLTCNGDEKLDPQWIGQTIIVGRHDQMNGSDDWTSNMDAYVGKVAHITKIINYDGSHCPVVEIDIDHEVYSWRVRNQQLQ